MFVAKELSQLFVFLILFIKSKRVLIKRILGDIIIKGLRIPAQPFINYL
jgi:hypothetical protein